MSAAPGRTLAVHPLLATALDLERDLGDPRDPGRVFSYRRCADADEREQFPVDVCRELDLLGVPRRYVPQEAGGDLDRYDEALQLLRVIARRDLTVAIGHGKTFLGAACVWVAGTPEQRRRLGEDVARGAVVSWGLTERDHGSDLLAGDVVARRLPDGPDGPDGYRVDGEKWLINNATRGHLVCVLARTGDRPGPRSLDVLLVDKRRLLPGSYLTLPAERLHGIRGADISGIRFTGAVVGPEALIGAPGTGLEVVLETLQLTRVLCAGLSLGAADHGVGLALEHARSLHRFGGRLADLPQTRRLLAQAGADLLLAEAVTLVAGRAVHALPGELAAVSAAVKYLLPTLVQRTLTDLGEVIGARSLLADGTYADGRFQKLLRDHRLVGIFDGSTVVNLHALITQFPFLGPARTRCDAPGLAAAVDLDAPLPPFDPARLALLPRHGCSLLAGLPAAAAGVREAAARGEVPASLAARVTALADRTADLLAQVERVRPSARDHPVEAFEAAQDVARSVAGAAAVQLWLANRHRLGEGPTGALWRDGLWLEAALGRLPARAGGAGAPFSASPDVAVTDRLARVLEEQDAAGYAPSLLPFPTHDALREG